MQWISPIGGQPDWRVAITTAETGNVSFRYDPSDVVRQRRENICRTLGLLPAHVLSLSLDITYGVHWLDSLPPHQPFLDNQGFPSEGVWMPASVGSLFLLVADCFPLAFFHPRTRRIGVFHAGRSELQAGLLTTFLELAQDNGISLSETFCFVGPGICSKDYRFETVPHGFLQENTKYIHKNEYGYNINLKEKIDDTLQGFGFAPSNIIYDGRCTYETSDLFSHRRSLGNNEQRFALVIRVGP